MLVEGSRITIMEYDLFTRPRRRVVWFSCGAASAVAAKLAVDKYGQDVRIVYCDTSANEDADNVRFMSDVEDWIGVEVETIRSDRFRTVEEVFEARKYMSGPRGAPCTVELKKKPRFAFQHPDDVHFFGMTAEETRRIRQFEKQNHELCLEWILRDWNLSKAACFKIIESAGIALPSKYLRGHPNNNCDGCVKATSPHYWNLVRTDTPDVFQRRAEQSRRIGCKLVRVKGKRIFLDELAPDCMEVVREDLSCGPQCRGAA